MSESQTHLKTLSSEEDALSEIQTFQDQNLVESFMQDLDVIAGYSYDKLEFALADISKTDLVKLRKHMVSKVCGMISSFKSRRPINRTARHLLMSDIHALTISISQGVPHKDLEKVFHPVIQTGENASNQDIDALVNTINLLTERLVALEEEVCLLRATKQTEINMNPISTSPLGNRVHSLQHKDGPTKQAATAQKQKFPAEEKQQQPEKKTDGSLSAANNKSAVLANTHQTQAASTSYAQAASLKAAPTQLIAAPKTREPNELSLYIGGIDASNTEKDIYQHLRRMGVKNNIQVKILRTKGKWRSFRATMKDPELQLKELCEKKHWPAGITTRKFKENARADNDLGRQRRRPGNTNGWNHWQHARSSNYGYPQSRNYFDHGQYGDYRLFNSFAGYY